MFSFRTKMKGLAGVKQRQVYFEQNKERFSLKTTKKDLALVLQGKV